MRQLLQYVLVFLYLSFRNDSFKLFFYPLTLLLNTEPLDASFSTQYLTFSFNNKYFWSTSKCYKILNLRLSKYLGRIRGFHFLGIDTTGNTSAFILYLLGSNPEKQVKTLLIDTLILWWCTRFPCTLIKWCSYVVKISDTPNHPLYPTHILDERTDQ